MTDRLATSVPKKMRGLAKDHRGYPIPFVVMRDANGKPCFTVNDSPRSLQALYEYRCPICGTRLDSIHWYVGGPLSAFHAAGAYRDTAMHYECMEYALRTCPYLAAPNYLGRIDAATIDPAAVAGRVFLDSTMIPERPAVLVAVAARREAVTRRGSFPELPVIRPERPYVAVEYWLHGKRIGEAEAEPLVAAALAAEGV